MKKIMLVLLILSAAMTLSLSANDKPENLEISSESQLITLDGDGLGGAPINGVPQTVVPVQEYTYDAQGNPINITNFLFEGSIYTYATLEWQGRELSKITVYQQGSYVPVAIMTYKYNDQGYRTSKKIDKITQGSQTISYTLDSDKVIYETDGTYAIIYTYDYDGKLIGFTYDPNVNVTSNEQDYFFLRNQLGDISHILNANGTTVVHYVYDAYGNIIKTDVTSGYAHIAAINSYTYRGYRYDSEIGMYYLNSRYYNPEIGRFINSDGLLGLEGDILTTNMYAYAVNNPIMNIDPSGYLSFGQNKWNSVQSIGLMIELLMLIIPALLTFSKTLRLLRLLGRIGQKALKKIAPLALTLLIKTLFINATRTVIQTMVTGLVIVVMHSIGDGIGVTIAKWLDKIDGNLDGYIFA
jgi:RHS repeat-associated protein